MRWVGTSMGNVIGMTTATTTLKDRISHLVINDVGLTPMTAAIERIKAYAGNPAHFHTVTK